MNYFKKIEKFIIIFKIIWCMKLFFVSILLFFSLTAVFISPIFADHSPDAPTNFAIDFDAVNGTNVPLSWTAPSGSLGNYTLQGALETSVGTYSDFMTIEDKTIWHNVTSFDLDTSGAPVTGVYYKLRLLATHGSEVSSPSTEVFGGNIPDNPSLFNSIEDFKSGRAFADSESFQSMQDFIGIMKFGANTDFDHATKFAAGQNFTEAQSFDNYQYFDDDTDFSELAQTFFEGTTFGNGTTFKSDGSQSLPAGTIPSFGVLLDSHTCTNSTCQPSDSDKFLEPGELLSSGTDPVATFTKVKPSDTTLSIDGLGLTMEFESITSTGTVKTDLIDPAAIPASNPAIESGKVSMGTTNSGNVETIGNIIDLTPEESKSGGEPASFSGTITITLPYDEENIPDGISESQLTMLHYDNGDWKTENNCTIDTVNNKITCTVTSLSPFGIGGPGANGSGNNKGNCDSNGFGNNSSLRIYEISYDVDTFEVQVKAYSTCGSISAKLSTPSGQSILGLSTDQPLVQSNVAVYSGFLDGTNEKFNISIQNKRDSFNETFYINDQSITKQYSGETGYTSEQQGTPLPTTASEQTIAMFKPSITQIVQTIEEPQMMETKKQILDQSLPTPKVQSIVYTPEPVLDEETMSQCGVGTKLVDGICKIIQTDESKFCFLFWCW